MLNLRIESLYSRGSLLVKQKRPAEAIETLKMALGLRPDNHFILGDVRHTQMKICEWEGFADDVFSLTRGIINNKLVAYPFVLLVLVDSTELQKTANQIYFDQLSKQRRAIISTKKYTRRKDSNWIFLGRFSQSCYGLLDKRHVG